ncbi:MAG: hypothetical protein H6579_09045 [Chitinophagales bacterium]|nr:hypothetical protein [Chitinophagales bacterium]
MDTNINFKSLWSEQKIATVNSKEIMEKIAAFKKKNLQRIILTNIALLFTSAFIIFVWLYYQPQFISTKLGIVLCILAMLIYLLVYNKSLSLFTAKNESLTNQEFLKTFKLIKKKQHFMHTKMLSFYYVLLSLGLALYLYEYTSRMTLVWAFVCYALSAGWIALTWFYFRPKQIKKQEKALQEILSGLDGLSGQMKEN